jgi:hypothetical protein
MPAAAPRSRITWAMPVSVMAPRPLSPSQRIRDVDALVAGSLAEVAVEGLG